MIDRAEQETAAGMDRGDERRNDRRSDRRSERRGDGERDRLPEDARVRDEDLEPFAALRYIARLFKVLAVLLLLLLVAEVVLGLMQAGTAALPGLLVDATRLLVFAGFLWAGGDLAIMLVETNHDLRATRILVGRLHHELEQLRSRMGHGDDAPRTAPRTTGPSGAGPRAAEPTEGEKPR